MRHVIIAVICFIIAGCHSQSHNLNLGYRTPGDTLLFETHEQKYGAPLIVRDTDVIFPKHGGNIDNVITAIEIKDNYVDGDGGYAKVKSGGLHQRYATIELKSQRGHGYDFNVRIFGRRG